MMVSGADLHVGEIRGRACRLLDPDRRMLVGARPVAESAIIVPSPCVGVAVAAHGQGMLASGADLHVGEIRRQVRIRLAIRLLHHDRRRPGVFGGCPVSELTLLVASPGVGVAVAAHGQRKTKVCNRDE